MKLEKGGQKVAGDEVERAVRSCAREYHGGSIPPTVQDLQHGRRDVWGTFLEHLAEGVGRVIGEYGQEVEVEGVYRCVVDPTRMRVQDEALTGDQQKMGLNLVVWSKGGREELSSQLQSLADQIGEELEKLGFASSGDRRFVHIDIVSDQEVRGVLGWGLVPSSEVIRTSQVWPPPSGYPASHLQVQGEREQGKLLETLTSFDPKLAPEERIIKHALAIEEVPEGQRGALAYHLMDLKVNLIRKIISDQLSYINIAKNWFRTGDLAELHGRRIGQGRIGGKAAGMILADRILEEVADEAVQEAVQVPESYFLGSDLIYIFMAMNGLMHWNDQKYKPEEDIWREHPQIVAEFREGQFPPEVLAELKRILAEMEGQPLIVRSSSQLEDNFGTVFAGKYDSFFCPNQGTPRENLAALTDAIARTYASTLKPEALLYRRRRGLQDYDERMAVLIQAVQGERMGRYFLPHAAGVAFSRNLYRWSPQIKREDGFLRLVWGLGTRAVGRTGEDYPRLVALSHPQLMPDDTASATRRYSQQFVDLIDLQDNAFKSLPLQEALEPGYKPLKYLAQVERDGYFVTPRMRIKEEDLPHLSLTFDKFLQNTPFVDLIRQMLQVIEEHYHQAVDMEFTAHLEGVKSGRPTVRISLLQCRPQPQLQDAFNVRFPRGLPEEDVIFSTRFMVPRGYLGDIRYILFVEPEGYFSLPTNECRNRVPRLISSLNEVLPEKRFLCVGPGRWGSANLDLGVFVSYADIHRAGALVEVSGEGIGPAPEPSLGTHFFQDLMEAQIYPLALDLDREDTVFNRAFFYETPNSIHEWLDPDPAVKGCLKLIEVASYREGHHLDLVMDDEEGQALAFVVPD